MQFRITACLAAVFTLLGVAIFSASAVKASDYFTTLDLNADSVLSGREVADLKALDSDGDAELTLEEFKAALAEHAQALTGSDHAIFILRDGNSDGRLSGTEISGFEYTDLNGDGRIPETEFLDGQRQQRGKLASLAPAQIRSLAAERLSLLDITEDGKLSGTELLGVEHYDVNRDKRVTAEEFTLGMILDSAAAGLESHPQVEGAEELIQLIVKSINDRDSRPVIPRMRPELLSVIDPPLVAYAVTTLHDSHRVLANPAADSIEFSPPGEHGEVQVTVPIACESGELTLRLIVIGEKLLGVTFESDAIEPMMANLSAELLTSDPLQDKFSKYYSPICRTLIQYVVDSKNDKAFAMFHPEVSRQLGREVFDIAFDAIRAPLGKVNSIDLESFGVETSADGTSFMIIGHLVKGTNKSLRINVKLQLLGLNAAIVEITSTPVHTDIEPEELPTPAAATDDDVPVRRKR